MNGSNELMDVGTSRVWAGVDDTFGDEPCGVRGERGAVGEQFAGHSLDRA
ncbi:hypothetical protein [Nocardia aurantiaca]|uniref:Uncharacterized protein n=1 Tax=Nocardia aurantiaca TaxID=2675850 RepID=A0A6I3L8I8_9NOCA|nr:hypothetical protein [Nocardia aurantiaca]MTE17380.1 hypothetical protein [Nocardia aurantiaca]